MSRPTKRRTEFSAERVKMYQRTRFNPIRSLTPDVLARQIDNWKAGHLREFSLTMDSIEERDDVIKTVAPKRKKAVARKGWEILTVDDSPEAMRQKEQLLFFYNNLSAINGIDLNERGGIKLLIRQMMDAVGKRYAVHEIVWQPRGAQLTAEFRFVPLWFFENTIGQLRFLASEGAVEGVPLEDGGWMVTVSEGIMLASSIAYMFKHLPLKDWLIYSERNGMPAFQGKTDSLKGSESWEALVDAVAALAADFSCVTSASDVIEKIDLSSSGELPYPSLVERMDRALASLWRGSDLGTLSRADGAGASIQGDETETLEQDDAELISETLQQNVDRRVISYLFGEGAPLLAYIQMTVPQRRDVALDLKVDEFLRDSGCPLTIADAMERYQRQLPATEAEPLLRASSQSRPSPLDALPLNALPNEDPSELETTSADVLRRALVEDLAPVRQRLERILAIEDPDILAARLRAFLIELPKLITAISADPAAAQVLDQTMSAAIANGILAAGKDRKT